MGYSLRLCAVCAATLPEDVGSTPRVNSVCGPKCHDAKVAELVLNGWAMRGTWGGTWGSPLRTGRSTARLTRGYDVLYLEQILSRDLIA